MGNKMLELIEILESEISLYESLLEVTSLEKEAMGKYFLEDMICCQKTIMSLNLDISVLEGRRKKITDKIAEENGMLAGELTLQEICCKADDEERERLESCRLTLKNLLEVLSATLKDNRRIALGSLEFVSQSIKVLSGYNVEQSTYLSSGMLEQHECNAKRVIKEV